MKISAYKRKYLACLFALILLSLTTANIHAQPAGNIILTGATAKKIDDCNKIEVSFSIPFRYLSHYPTHEGNDLRIQLLPLSESYNDSYRLSDHEMIRIVTKDIETGIKEIIYEKAYSSQRPFLGISFDHKVYFAVKSGDAFRSVVILLSDTKNSKCLDDSK